MKNKIASALLIIGAFIWMVNEFYFFIKRLNGGNWVYYKDHLFDFFLTCAMMLVPLCLLIFAISQWIQKDSKDPIATIPAVEGQEPIQNLSVGDWLINYLISAIPLIGFICIVIWANDDKNKVRQNWAVASLVWMGILYILLIFLYITVFASMRNSY